MLNDKDRYIAGGRLYLTEKKEDGSYDTEVEIGEIKDLKITPNIDTTECLTQENGLEETADEVIIKQETEFSCTTNEVSTELLRKVLLGEVTTETVVSGSVLPDGTTATADTTVETITPFQKKIFRGKFRFVAEKLNGGSFVIKGNEVSLRIDGDLNLITKEFATIGLKGKFFGNPPYVIKRF